MFVISNIKYRMRFFVAVEISDEVRTAVARRIEFLRRRFPDLRVGWEKPEKLHLTLKFLGEISEDKLADVINATGKAIQSLRSFELVIAGANVFPFRGATRVLWLDVTRGKEMLLQINRRLEDECFAFGFERSEHPFTPHLTIARLREPNQSQQLTECHLAKQFPAIACLVSEVVIFQTQHKPHGVFYLPLERFALNQ